MDVRKRVGGTDFIWSDEKASFNVRKHSVRFEDALAVFEDPLCLLVDASRNDEGRHALIGFDAFARLLFVVHVQVEMDCIRIISARVATSTEEDLYDQ
ncbi:MAG: BrnT family toxin [Burkholderiaceae bacterium]